MSKQINNLVEIFNNQFIINGTILPPVPKLKNSGTSVVNINGKVFINGYEWKGETIGWKKTIKAWFHYWF